MSDELVDTIEAVAVPMLRPIATIEDFVNAVMTKWQGHHLINDDWTRVCVEFSLGNVELAKELCSGRLCNYAEPGPKEASVWSNTVKGTQEPCSLLRANDICGAIRLLHDWEMQTVQSLKIDHLWERTPFPIEEKLGLA